MKACRRPRALAVLLVAVVLAVAGCSGSEPGTKAGDGSIRGVEVSGAVGERPTVRIATPLAVPTSQTQFAVVGTGPQIQIDQLFVLQLTMVNARTGDVVASTLDAGQVPVVAKSSDDTLFPALVSALAGKPQGSRVVLVLAPSDAFGAGGIPPTGLEPTDPVVLVADVLAVPPVEKLVRATGTALTPPAGAPQVQLIADDPTAITVPAGLAAPDAVTVVPLVEGDGPPVRDHSLVTLDYLGQDWGTAVPFVDTYFKEPVVFPVGAEGSLPAWDQALVGLRAGSRVLVVDPSPPDRVPGEASAADHETIAWVIDVLGVS